MKAQRGISRKDGKTHPEAYVRYIKEAPRVDFLLGPVPVVKKTIANTRDHS